MIYNFDELPNRWDTDSIKWNHYPEDVLPLWVADMDFISPEPVIRELRERVAHGVFGYAGDLPGLRDTIINYLAASYDWHVLSEDIVLLPGVVAGFNLAAQAFIGPGEGILIQTPVYGPFLDTARHVGGLRQEMELTRHPDGYYSVDWDASSRDLIAAARPALAIVSAGRGNIFGHPSPAVLDRYRRAGLEVLRTDLDGAIVVETDGRTVLVKTWTGRRISLSAR